MSDEPEWREHHDQGGMHSCRTQNFHVLGRKRSRDFSLDLYFSSNYLKLNNYIKNSHADRLEIMPDLRGSSLNPPEGCS